MSFFIFLHGILDCFLSEMNKAARAFSRSPVTILEEHRLQFSIPNSIIQSLISRPTFLIRKPVHFAKNKCITYQII